MPQQHTNDFPVLVTAFGAKPDGENVNTKPFQDAVDRVAEAGGGTVLVPPGQFVTGTVRLRDNVRLWLEPGAEVLGSESVDDFPEIDSPYNCRTGNVSKRALILATDATNIAVEGHGTLNARGAWWNSKEHGSRPYVLRILRCSGVRVRDVTLRDPGFWAQHYLLCNDVVIDGIVVRSRCNKNNDGLDINSCANVRVSNCDISSRDDAIVIKAGTVEPCRNIAITNCVLSTNCNAIKFGTESAGGFQDIAISNITMNAVTLAGLALEIMDGGTMQRISATNLVMNEVQCPLFMRLADLGRAETFDGPRQPIGAMRDILISNIQHTGGDLFGCSITGQPDAPIENVTIRDFRARFAGGGTVEEAGREIEEQRNAYPEYNRFGHLPSYGFFCRHVRNLRFSGLELTTVERDARPAMVADDVSELIVDEARLHASASGHPLIRLRNANRARLERIRGDEPGATLIDCDESCRSVHVSDDPLAT